MSINFRNAWAAQARLAEWKWLEKELNVEELSTLRAAVWIPTVYRTEGQGIAPLWALLKFKDLSNDAWYEYAGSVNLITQINYQRDTEY
jgi:hypothetical protein